MKRSILVTRTHRPSPLGSLQQRAVTLAGVAALSLGVAAAASASPSPWLPYHEGYGPQVTDDACGVDGFSVEQVGFVDGRSRFVAHGSDGLPFYYDRGDFDDRWTNLATGEFLTVDGSYQGGATRVTDNGDGTVTVHVKNTDNTLVYSADGQLLARDTGTLRYELLIDQAGTPQDPSDDEVIGFLGVVTTTGLDYDFCALLVGEIG